MKRIAISLLVLALAGCVSQTEQPPVPASIELGDNSPSFNSEPTEAEPENPSSSESGQGSDSTSESLQDMVIDKAELEIEDQSGDGSSVRILEIETTLASGFVVIFDGAGEVLGSAAVSSRAQPVTIELTKKVTQSSELIAGLFADNGNGVFDPSDLPVYEQEEDGLEKIEEDFDYEVL